MQTLVEDFLPSLRHERGRSAGNKRRDAEAAEIRRGGTNRMFWPALKQLCVSLRSLRLRVSPGFHVVCAPLFIRNPRRAQ